MILKDSVLPGISSLAPLSRPDSAVVTHHLLCQSGRVIIVSWVIAFVEYCLQVPANRWGHEHFSAPQLKIMQEAITLTVFIVFSLLYLKEAFRWDYAVSFALDLAAVDFALKQF